MSVNINASTTNGLVLTSDTSGEIKLQSAGAEIVSVTANGMAVDTNTLYVDATNNRVGIGTSSPSATLHVVGGQSYVTGSSGAGAYSRWYNNAQTSSDLQIGQGWSSGSDNVGFVLNNANADLLFGTNGSERMRINNVGNVGIGITTPNTYLVVYGNTGTAVQRIFNISGVNTYQMSFHNSVGEVGTISTGSGSTSYNTSSDYRLKENNVDIFDGISRVKLLKPYRFNFIAHPEKTVDGFFAHEVQSVVPEAITGTKDAVDDEGNPVYQGIDQAKLVPLLTAALQEAITKIEDLETRIQALENA